MKVSFIRHHYKDNLGLLDPVKYLNSTCHATIFKNCVRLFDHTTFYELEPLDYPQQVLLCIGYSLPNALAGTDPNDDKSNGTVTLFIQAADL